MNKRKEEQYEKLQQQSYVSNDSYIACRQESSLTNVMEFDIGTYLYKLIEKLRRILQSYNKNVDFMMTIDEMNNIPVIFDSVKIRNKNV